MHQKVRGPLLGFGKPALAMLVIAVVLVSALITVARPPRQAVAAATNSINFQARLMNGSGAIVADGFYNVEFKLYNVSSGGAALWTDTYYDSNGVTAGNDARVRVQNGYLTVSLGSQASYPFPGTINWDQQLWITMNIGGTTQTATPTWDGEMTPRLLLTAVPYAFQAAKASQLQVLAGANTATLSFAGSFGQNTTVTLPDPGATTATVCYQGSASCGFATGTSGSYIQNGTSVQTSANFNIRSAATGSVGAVVQGASGQTADLLQLQSWNGTTATNVFSVNNSGVTTLAGGQTIDITTATAATATALTLAPGVSSAATTTGAGLNLYGGAVSGTTTVTGGQVTIQGGNATGGSGTRNGGAVTIDGGTGASANGAVNIGTANSPTINIGSVGTTAKATAINIGTTTTTTSGAIQSITIGSNSNLAHTTVIQGGSGNGAGSEAIRLVPQTTGGIAIGSTTGTGTITLGQSAASNTINIGNANFTAANTQTINIANGSQSTAASTLNVNILSGAAGSTGTAFLNLGNNDRVQQIDIGNVAADGNRTLNLFTGNTIASTTDTINIGTGNAAGSKVIHIGDGTPSGSGVNTITVGSTALTSTTTVQGGTGSGAVSIQAGTSGTISLGSTNANTVTIGATGVATAVNVNGGNGSSGNITLQTNNAATGVIVKSTTNSTAAFVIQDSGATNTYLNVSTSGQAITVGYSGSTTTLNGTVKVATLGASTANSASVCRDTSTNTLTSCDANTTGKPFLQGGNTFGVAGDLGTNDAFALNVRTGGTTRLTVGATGGLSLAAGNTLTVTSALTSLTGATTGDALNVSNSTSTGNIAVFKDNATAVATIADGGSVLLQNSSNSATAFQVQNALGTAVAFDVDTTNTRIGVGTAAPSYNLAFGAGANRTIGVETQTASNTAGNSLTISSGAGNGTGAGGALLIQGAAGGSTSTGGAGGAVNITAGNAGGSGNNAGGNIVLQAGAYSGSGASGAVIIKNATNGEGFIVEDSTGAHKFISVDTSDLVVNLGTTGTEVSSTTVNIGTSTAQDQYVNIGSTASFGSTNIAGGSAGINIGTSTGTAQIVNIGGTSGAAANNTTVLMQGGNTGAAVQIQALASGSISIGTNNAGNIVQIGSNTLSTGTQVINVGNNSTSGGTTNITIGTGSGATAGTTSVQAKTSITLSTNGVGRVFMDNTATMYLGGSAASVAAPNDSTIQGAGASAATVAGAAVKIQGGTGNTTGNGGKVTLQGGTAGGSGVKGLIELNGGTYFTTGSYSSGSTATITQSVVDSNSAILASATATSLTFTVPTPTNGASQAGRILYIINSGSNAFTLSFASTSFTLNPGSTASLVYTGSAWTSAGVDAATLQNAYGNSSGSTTPEILLDTTRRGLDVQDANTTLGSTEALLSVRASATATTLGNSLFTVNASGKVGINIGSTSTTPTISNDLSFGQIAGATTARTIGVEVQGTTNIGGNGLTATAGTGNGTGAGGQLTLQGGAASATAGSNGGAVSILGAVGSSTGTGGTGGNILLSAGNAGGSGANAGGNITLNLGGATSTGTSGAFFVQNTLGANLLTVDPSNTYNGLNLALNPGAEVSGTFATNWTAHAGTGSPTITQTSTSGEFASGTAAVKVATTNANQGVRNNLGAALTVSTTYIVSFSVKSSTSITDLTVAYYRNNTPTLDVSCSNYSSQAADSTGWKKVSCTFATTSNAGAATAFLAITQVASATRNIFIDNLSIVAQNSSGTSNVGDLKVGGALSQGLTLLTLDTYAGTPFTGSNSSLAGSMYFDTTSGKIQCYDGSSWGACGAAPNGIVTLTPEYAGAVLNGSGIGTMTSDFCANSAALTVGTLCGTNDARNFYKWTSPQGTAQAYSIYVTYKLPPTFKAFVSGSTSLTGLVDNTTNATVKYAIFKSTGSAITSCSALSTVVGWNGSSAVGTANTWTSGVAGTLSGTTDPSGCSFAAGNNIIFQIQVLANSNASAYAENLNFQYSNQ